MGSGPIVIGDDGSPPPGLKISSDPPPVHQMQVGRLQEYMEELKTPQKPHTAYAAFQISRVQVVQNGAIYATVFSPGEVKVTGNAKTVITASAVAGVANSAGSVNVLSSVRLQRPTPSTSGDFMDYQANDTAITLIQIDDIDIPISEANQTRVEIFP